MLLPVITVEHILPRHWLHFHSVRAGGVCVCVCALCRSLFAAIIVKLSAVAHPGRHEAIHGEIGNPTSEKKVQKSNTQKMQWASTRVSKSIMS